MVTNYKRKKVQNYSSDDLRIAVSRIVKKEISFNAAHQQYKIPKATLHRNLQNAKDGRFNRNVGHPSVLSAEEERLLAQALGYLADCGHPQDRRTLKVKNSISFCFL